MSQQASTTQNPEVEILRNNVRDQFNRLLDQLDDLELLRDELTQSEYDEEKQDTIEQLREFQQFLDTTLHSNSSLSLSTEFTATQEAIKNALNADNFHSTTTNLRKFATQDSTSIRSRIDQLERSYKLKIISQSSYQQELYKLLLALTKIDNVELTSLEQQQLKQLQESTQQLQVVNEDNKQYNLLEKASVAIGNARK